MKRILIIEDDVVLRQTFSQHLQNAKYTVIEAEHGAEAVLQLHQSPVDLVITDMLMPEMDGVETIQALRYYFPATKIIAMSGGGAAFADSYLNIARRLGVHRTMAKPFTLQELLDNVNEMLAPK